MTAGTLLLSRSKRLGIPLVVEVVGEPREVEVVPGPAVFYSQVLASCGVGRELGEGPLVVIPGPEADPVLCNMGSFSEGSPWFLVDTSGEGQHPATRDFVKLLRSRNPDAIRATATIGWLFRWLNIPLETSLLDLLFNAPVSPLDRLGVTIRAAREMTGGGRTRSLTQSLVKGGFDCELLAEGFSGGEVIEAVRRGDLDELFSSYPEVTSRQLRDWLDQMERVAAGPDDIGLEIVSQALELMANVAMLPVGCMLPAPPAEAIGVARGMVRALGARKSGADANGRLVETYRFLGGRFVDFSEYPVMLTNEPPPTGRVERLEWLIRSAESAADEAERIWKRLMNPAS